MNCYIATFYSHYGALSYFKELEKQGITATMMPVPRRLSSSCGTCVSYENDSAVHSEDCELDAVYLKLCDAYECVCRT